MNIINDYLAYSIYFPYIDALLSSKKINSALVFVISKSKDYYIWFNY
jgi:hypothetical protein